MRSSYGITETGPPFENFWTYTNHSFAIKFVGEEGLSRDFESSGAVVRYVVDSSSLAVAHL